MSAPRRPRPLLDAASLERLALRYVERFATTRGRLTDYLDRKIRERGWGEEQAPDSAALAERMAGLGYVDDAAYAEAKAGSLSRRGYGARRVREALRHAGVSGEDADRAEMIQEDQVVASALAFARRRRIGPFATVEADPALLKRQVSAMVRAGHAPALAWAIAKRAPGEYADPDSFSD
jgi:regulatory protein